MVNKYPKSCRCPSWNPIRKEPSFLYGMGKSEYNWDERRKVTLKEDEVKKL